jgi:hypothetical protein
MVKWQCTWGACSSNFHPRLSNSFCNHSWYFLSLCGPALSSWWTTIAPAHRPPGAASRSRAGINTCSHKFFRAYLGFVGVPTSVPVTLQSVAITSPLACDSTSAPLCFFWLTLKDWHLCSPMRTPSPSCSGEPVKQ